MHEHAAFAPLHHVARHVVHELDHQHVEDWPDRGDLLDTEIQVEAHIFAAHRPDVEGGPRRRAQNAIVLEGPHGGGEGKSPVSVEDFSAVTTPVLSECPI